MYLPSVLKLQYSFETSSSGGVSISIEFYSTVSRDQGLFSLDNPFDLWCLHLRYLPLLNLSLENTMWQLAQDGRPGRRQPVIDVVGL